MLVKQVIVIRKDLGMRRGKEIAQGAHAAMAWLTRRMSFGPDRHAAWIGGRLSPAEFEWLANGFRKITVRVYSAQELDDVVQAAVDAGLSVEVITDSGLTEFGGVPTVTCAAIGPDYDDKIDVVTGHLDLY
jgi:peptidyl-tRNA hydrolase, PTH2 family